MAATILVVDDEAIARAYMERALKQEGYQVIVASDGEEALQTLQTTKEKIALVITDLVMPGMGGHAFAIEVGQLPSPPPVLYVSAYEKPQGEMARRFLQKPFSIAELGEAVRQMLGEGSGSRV
jgi:two-component system, cell cycle sensor histidine kinase and response regulator CckA